MEFEDAMARLEQIVSDLEGGELRLAEALRLYEEGVTMAKVASDLLDQAEAKVELLLADGGTAPLDPAGEAVSGG